MYKFVLVLVIIIVLYFYFNRIQFTNTTQNTCILLTTIINTEKGDINERLNMYLEVINDYLKNTELLIHVVESSGYTFPEFKNNPRIIVHSFKSTRKKGSSSILEAESILSAINNLNLSNYEYIIKITGRYYIPNLSKLVDDIPANADFLFQSKYSTGREWQNSEIFGCRIRYMNLVCDKILKYSMAFEKALYLFSIDKNYTSYRFPEIKLDKPVIRGGDKMTMNSL